jgi:three-Cys-motif partner protein
MPREDNRRRFETEPLFSVAEAAQQPVAKKFKAPGLPVWTDSKARLIERYLHYFVLVTRHGAYIDGFAGPQYLDVDEYAAKLVLERELERDPPRLRHFHLVDVGRPQVDLLRQLQARSAARDVRVYGGDFNKVVDQILQPSVLRPTEATFCLLDQRTFECHWDTVRKLAAYRTTGYKIELFYFLANGWLERALAALQDYDRWQAWWGRSDWQRVATMTRGQRAEELRKRFETELGYRFVMAWAIYAAKETNRVMYYMIHASDHPEAPKLMERAYTDSVRRQGGKQLRIQLPETP